MRRLELEATANSPYVSLDAEKGEIEIKGISHPEDSVGFYEIVLSWINENFNQLSQKIKVNIQLDYFNTSSSKSLFKLFQLLGKKKKTYENEIEINWFFIEEDEDMIDAGKAYEEISNLPFNLVVM